LNPSLRGLGLSRIPNPAWTVAIFESDDEKNIVYRHDDRTNYAFMDGHVKQYQRGHEEELIWNLRREDLTTTAHSGKGER
jgi:prepilin-type processing-associated H-X9-DG protein